MKLVRYAFIQSASFFLSLPMWILLLSLQISYFINVHQSLLCTHCSYMVTTWWRRSQRCQLMATRWLHSRLSCSFTVQPAVKSCKTTTTTSPQCSRHAITVRRSDRSEFSRDCNQNACSKHNGYHTICDNIFSRVLQPSLVKAIKVVDVMHLRVFSPTK